jgi:anti-sigma B factor antagonist
MTVSELEAALDKTTLEGVCELVIDLANLEYISSAGLRVLLSLKKQIAALKVKNVRPEIMEIFDMTGFTGILAIE